MSYDEHQAMWPQMIAALAAIDAALGLPDDGCNSTAQTLAEIKRLRDVAREAADAATKHQAEVLRLRAALAGVRQYGADTLSGRTDGPDDRAGLE